MTPKLIALAGPAVGASFPLTLPATTLGRHTDNAICIADPRVSRFHCRIEQDQTGCMLFDVGSTLGSFVNETPVRAQTLAHGDMVRLGDSYFRFVGGEPEAVTADKPLTVEAEEGEWSQQPTLTVAANASRYLDARELTASASQRTQDNYQALLCLTQTLSIGRSLDELQQSIFATIGKQLPAARGVLLLMKTGEGEFASAYGWTRVGREEGRQALTFSRKLVLHALSQNKVWVCDDVMRPAANSTTTFAPSESIVRSGATSVLAAPLSTFGRTLGALYLATHEADRRFDEEDAQLVAAIAQMSAAALEHAWRFHQLEEDCERLRAAYAADKTMIGQSATLRLLRDFIVRAACRPSTVLIGGESGTGKELVAFAIHQQSERSKGPFVAINCAALPKELIESELFGHVPGAFTGAPNKKKIGLLKAADGGTLLLDEIGELPLEVQPKLLRALQERKITPVGATQPEPFDARLIAATNRDLETEIKLGRFREDLYHRLKVLEVRTPPLRERRDDIELLALHFIHQYAQRCKRPTPSLSQDARACLIAYDWPGNVRELENTIIYAVDLGLSEQIEPEDLPERLRLPAPPPALSAPALQQHLVTAFAPADATADAPGALDYHAAVCEARRWVIQQAFARAGGKHTQAARLLGVHPNNLHRLLRDVGLKKPAESK